MISAQQKIKEGALKQVYPFKSHYLNLGGNNLHYVDEGEGQPILMLHGNPTWSFYYRNLVATFGERFRCVVPDHIGCGLSDKPQDYEYTLENHIENVVKLIKFLNLKKIILVVHDWGGAIGFGVLTRHPELFDRVVILNTSAFFVDTIPWQINLLRQGKFGEFLNRKFNLFAWPATFMTTVKRLPKIIKEGYLLPYDSYANRVAVARFVQDIPMESTHPTRKTLDAIEKKLPYVDIPKLILWGGRDFCFHKAFFDRWTALYPDAETHYFENAGHYVIEDELEEVSGLLMHFFRGSKNEHRSSHS